MFFQEAITRFVSELKEQGVFAKEVRSAGVAFHSYYMASIAPTLLDALKKVCSSIIFQQYVTYCYSECGNCFYKDSFSGTATVEPDNVINP